MGRPRLTKSASPKPTLNSALDQDYPARLAELEAELRLHAARQHTEQPLKAIGDLEEAVIDREKVLQFVLGPSVYAAGHADVIYAGSNHARGVRHIRFYAAGKTVLDIEGDFENQQFGTNFRFQNMDLYLPGEWERDFRVLTDQLRQHTARRRQAFRKRRDAEHARLRRR